MRIAEKCCIPQAQTCLEIAAVWNTILRGAISAGFMSAKCNALAEVTGFAETNYVHEWDQQAGILRRARPQVADALHDNQVCPLILSYSIQHLCVAANG